MPDLIDFLRARLDDDERAAKEATRGPWKWDDYRVPTLEGRAGTPGEYEWDTEVIEASHSGECGCRSACTLELTVSDADREHIARHDPARVLRDVAAKRAIIDRAEFVNGHGPAVDHTRALDMQIGGSAALHDVMRVLAAAYSDHPDYRPEWQRA